MFVSNLKLWNFRKFGGGGSLLNSQRAYRDPDLELSFHKGLNLLLGENDSGKSAIVDALKLVLKTHSTEWIKIEKDDFHRDATHLRIEVMLEGPTDAEAKNFIEWMGMSGTGADAQPFLRLILDVHRTKEKVMPFEVKAGMDAEGYPLTADARELLKAVYLKPLRDAEGELISRKNSRLSQILRGHEAFKGREDDHYLKDLLDLTNKQVEKYFEGKKMINEEEEEVLTDEPHGLHLKESINEILTSFFRVKDPRASIFSITGKELSSILESLKLSLSDAFCGLGSNNLLFIATELILLKRSNWEGLRLGLVEEIEAHLHPQAQIRVMRYLEQLCCQEEQTFQLILTSHSPNLASVASLEHIILCKDGKAHSLRKGATQLAPGDYAFLTRFLDVTKANLFFARSVLLVEGYAENILLPVLADRMGRNLSLHGVSIVNIGSTAYLRYARIFIDENENGFSIPVSVVTDLDLKPAAYAKVYQLTNKETLRKNQVVTGYDSAEIDAFIQQKKIQDKQGMVQTFVAPYWTLEYCLALCPGLRQPFFEAVLLALKEQRAEAGTKNFKKLNELVENIGDAFTNWTLPAEDIAFTIYHDWILKKSMSKAIIAQHFANLIQEQQLDVTQNTDPIQYLLDAIYHVTN